MLKNPIQGKRVITNKIENVKSQLRDRISYLVRRIKAYAKSEEGLNHRLTIYN